MLIEHDGKRPKIDPSARIAPTAVLCGDVTIGPGTSVGFGAVLSAESGPIALGAMCIVMDNAVVRAARRYPVTIGERVLIGPQALLLQVPQIGLGPVRKLGVADPVLEIAPGVIDVHGALSLSLVLARGVRPFLSDSCAPGLPGRKKPTLARAPAAGFYRVRQGSETEGAEKP